MFLNIIRDFACFSCKKFSNWAIDCHDHLQWQRFEHLYHTNIFCWHFSPVVLSFYIKPPLCKGQRCNTIRKGVRCPGTSTRGCQHGFFCESHWNQHKVSVGFTEQESSIYEEVMLLKSSKGARLQRERANKELDVQSVCLPWSLIFYSEL